MRYAAVVAALLLTLSSTARAQDTQATRKAYTERACRVAVKDKLTSPGTVRWGASVFRDHRAAGRFVLRSTAVSRNPLGTDITHRFVCIVNPRDGTASVVFRATRRDLYDEMVRVFGLGDPTDLNR